MRNVRDSDATLIVNLGELDGGSLETLRIAERRGKPVRCVRLDDSPDGATVDELRSWALGYPVLNIAGPRESKRQGIYRTTYELLDRLFAAG